MVIVSAYLKSKYDGFKLKTGFRPMKVVGSGSNLRERELDLYESHIEVEVDSSISSSIGFSIISVRDNMIYDFNKEGNSELFYLSRVKLIRPVTDKDIWNEALTSVWTPLGAWKPLMETKTDTRWITGVFSDTDFCIEVYINKKKK